MAGNQAEDYPHPSVIMRLIVNRPEFMRRISLTEREIYIFKAVKEQKDPGMTSREVSKKLAISIQNASTALNKMHSKGYLRRSNQGHDSGGDEYIYRVAI